MKIFKRIFSLHLAISLGILALTFSLSYVFGIWSGYPTGYDALFHVFKTKHILDNWPYHHWWSIWAAGMPLFLYYPPLPHYALVVLHLITGLSIEFLLTLTATAAIGVTGIAIYLIAYCATNNYLLSSISSLMYLAYPESWSIPFKSGVYMRGLAMPLFMLSLFSAIIFFRRLETKSESKKPLALTSLFLGLTIMTHQFIAVISIATILFLTAFIKGKIQSKIIASVKILILSLLVASSFVIPLALQFPVNKTTSWVTAKATRPVSTSATLHLKRGFAVFLETVTNNVKYSKLSNQFSEITGVFLIILLVLKIKDMKLKPSLNRKAPNMFIKLYKKTPFVTRMLLFSSSLTILWKIYGTGSLFNLKQFIPLINSAYAFLGTSGAVYFIPIFSSIAMGILLHLLLPRNRLLSYPIIGFLLVLNALFIRDQYTFRLKSSDFENGLGVRMRESTYRYPLLSDTIEELENNNYRHATQRIKIEDPVLFNLRFPNISQTDHYFNPGVANFDLYYYFSEVLWKEGTDNETNFFLNWWGIDTIIANSSGRFSNREAFDVLDSAEGMNVFRYKNSSPILSPTNASTLLYIGNKESYQGSLFHAFALSNLNSDQIIPVIGKSEIDRDVAAILSYFDTVFLYDYQISSLAQTSMFLNDYVLNGGNLIIESNRTGESGVGLPDPFPIESIEPSVRQGKWNFNLHQNTYLTNPDLDGFAPADFEGEGWKISEGSGVKDWATTVITSEGEPVVVEGRLGKGKVLWSGLNLPFHSVYNNNEQELEVLQKILLEYTKITKKKESQFKTEFINPHQRKIQLENEYNGVLFKETYFPNWKASALTSNGKANLDIHQAGPGFMFVFLPVGTNEVTFFYRRSAIEWISDIISLLALGWIVVTLSLKKSQNSVK